MIREEEKRGHGTGMRTSKIIEQQAHKYAFFFEYWGTTSVVAGLKIRRSRPVYHSLEPLMTSVIKGSDFPPVPPPLATPRACIRPG